jgi:N-acyl-L-homoserine lactone synthetase
MHIIDGTAEALGRTTMEALAKYRHRVFIEKLGWSLPTHEGREVDQFDHGGTRYAIAMDADGDIVGSARLLPTDQPYLLGDVFPELMGNVAVPRDPEVWELSRFSAVDLSATAPLHSTQFSSPIAVALLQHVRELAARHGVHRLITVSPLGVERLLRRACFPAFRAAPPRKIDDHWLFACYIAVRSSDACDLAHS